MNMFLFRNKSKLTKLKVCGISREEDILACDDLGVDALGFLIGDANGQSPTDKLTKDEAKLLIAKVPDSLKAVLLLKSEDINEIDNLVNYINPDVVQLQNNNIKSQTVKLLRKKYSDIEWIKTVKVQKGDSAQKIIENIQGFIEYIDAVLLDSEKGGSGQVHNWNISRYVASFLREKSVPVVLAGGINEANLRKAVEEVNPHMIDVMTGVSLNRGIKDKNKIATLRKVINELNGLT